MKLLFTLIGHLLVTLARLASPDGLRSVVAESLAVKHQLLIMRRSQRRAPKLTSWDRLILGFCTPRPPLHNRFSRYFATFNLASKLI